MLVLLKDETLKQLAQRSLAGNDDLKQQLVPHVDRSRQAPVQAVDVEAAVLAGAVAVPVWVPVRPA